MSGESGEQPLDRLQFAGRARARTARDRPRWRRECATRRSVTRIPSGLESTIALVVSKRAARIGNCSKPKEKSSNPKSAAKRRARRSSGHDRTPARCGASHSATIAPAQRARKRQDERIGRPLDSVHQGGGGVEFIRGPDPRTCASRARRVRSPWACASTQSARCLGDGRPTRPKLAASHSFQRDCVLL